MSDIILSFPEKVDTCYKCSTGRSVAAPRGVCMALGYNNSRDAVRRHVDEGDALKQGTPTTSGIQQMLYVNESGLYSLILSSKLKSARRFKHWVTAEVLPAIRQQGGYMVALGYNNSRDAVRRHVEDEDVAKHDTPTTSGIQQMLYVNESGLYALILGRGAVADVEQLEEAR